MCSLFLVLWPALCLGTSLDNFSLKVAQDGNIVYHLLADPEICHFTYNDSREDGPSDWGTNCPYWETCSSGNRQSPIDIRSESVASWDEAHFHESYAENSSVTLTNNGHTIVASFSRESNIFSVAPLDEDFALVQFHYHSPAEHLINGEQYALEVHLVHSNKFDPTEIAVLSFIFEEDDANPSPVLATLIEAMKKSASQLEQEGGTESSFLPLHSLFLDSESGSYYSYLGSLTTPPCTEAVTWFVHSTLWRASSEQINFLTSLIPGRYNARPVQQLGVRTLTLYGPENTSSFSASIGGVISLVVLISIVSLIFIFIAFRAVWLSTDILKPKFSADFIWKLFRVNKGETQSDDMSNNNSLYGTFLPLHAEGEGKVNEFQKQ